MVKRLTAVWVCVLWVTWGLAGQEVLTAQQFFDQVAQRYAQIKDYVADITITTPQSVMRGTLFYKRPGKLRIDFSEPEDQVLVSTGEELLIYVPSERVVLQQSLSGSGLQLATGEGLALLRRNYSIAYLEGPGYVSLDPEELVAAGKGSPEPVVKLNLTWRSTRVGFRQIIMSVGQDGYMRRLKGVTVDYQEVTFDFVNIRVNQNLPDARFEYDSPPSANVYYNFLFNPES